MRGAAAVGFVVDRIDRLLALAVRHRLGARRCRRRYHRSGAAGWRHQGRGRPEHDQVIKSVAAAKRAIRPARRRRRRAPRTGRRSQPVVRPRRRVQALISLLSFRLGEQEYALPLDRVREIVPLPDHISALPRPETAVLGVITLRDRLLPLVSLRALLGMAADDEQRTARQGRGGVVGRWRGRRGGGCDPGDTPGRSRTSSNRRRPCSPAATVTPKSPRSAGSKTAQRLVALLSPDRLFRSELVRRILAEQTECRRRLDLQSEANAMADEQFIIFRLGDQDYGIPDRRGQRDCAADPIVSRGYRRRPRSSTV